nr:adult cement protein 14 [Chelonibia testudinaria]
MHGFIWFFLLGMAAAYSNTIPTGLDLKLMKAVTTKLNKNEAISPFVMSSLMTQVLVGARGVTMREMIPVLGVKPPVPWSFLPAYRSAIDYLSTGSSSVTTRVFNRIYVKKRFSLKRSFRRILTRYYRAGVRRFSSPASAAKEINTDVAKVTNNLIKDLVTPGALQNSRVVLVSALYFKGLWKNKFDPRRTSPQSFFTTAGAIQVPMMHLGARVLPYTYKAGSYDAIALPYKDEDYSMVLIRPLSKDTASVRHLRDSLNSMDIARLVSQMQPKNLAVSMPRFKIKTEYKDLETTFKNLGIRTLFTSRADLRGMAYTPLQVNKIILKVLIDVDEKGTEAAGAGAVVVGITSLPPQFILDRPFFAIVWNKKHNMNLFTAYVGSPSS